MVKARAALKGLGDEIDTTNDRTAWLAQSVLGIGPAFVPLAAGAIPVVTGIATQMTIAAAAAGTAALAFNGVGDGLKALNDYQLDPSAANMEKLVTAMDKIGPVGEEFVRFLDQTGQQLSGLDDIARRGMFPGIEEGITSMLTLLPQVNRIVHELSTGMGQLAAEGGAALGGPRFADFFDFLERNAKPILLDMGHTIGFFAEGLANLLVQFEPLSVGFSHGFADMARSFAEWSRSLDENASFQSFLDYIDEAGPRTMNFLASLTDAFVSILHAAAPVGEILLPAFSQLLEIIAHLAATPLGPLFIGAAAAMSLYGRAVALASITTGGLLGNMLRLNTVVDGKTKSVLTNAAPSWRQFGNAMLYAAQSNNQLTRGSLDTLPGLQKQYKRAIEARTAVAAYGRQLAGTASQVGLMAFAVSGLADKMGLSNTAMLAMAGNMVGKFGGAIGASIGAILDYNAATSEMTAANKQAQEAISTGEIDKMTAALTRQAQAAQTAFGMDISAPDFNLTLNPLQNVNRVVGLLNGSLRVMQSELANTQGALAGAAGWTSATKFLSSAENGFRALTGETHAADDALRAYIASYDVFQGRMSKQQGLINFRNQLRELGAVVKDNPMGKGLDATKQGDSVRSALLAPIQQVQELAKNMKGLEHVQFMKTARAQILQRAAELGLPLQKVQNLLSNMGILDRTDARPKIQQQGAERAQVRIALMRGEIAKLRSKMVKMDERGAAAARARIRQLQAAINALHDKSITITTFQRTHNVSVGGKVRKASGGLVLAGAGQSRGAKDDSIDARLSHLEYVQQAAAVQKYGVQFMDDINNLRYPKPRGYAEGGLVRGGGTRVSVAAPRVSTGDTYVRVMVDGKELRALIDTRIDERADVTGSYNRASRNADD